jgi:hypothetical protein
MSFRQLLLDNIKLHPQERRMLEVVVRKTEKTEVVDDVHGYVNNL